MNSPIWKCPSCGTLLQKRQHDLDMGAFVRAVGGRRNINVTGGAVCPKCNTSYNPLDVYEGKFDVIDPSSIKGTGQPSTAKVVVGTCPKCGRDLKVKPHRAKKNKIYIQCKCRWTGWITKEEWQGWITKEKKQKPTPKDSGGCFIATATLGSYDAPEVLKLRSFRDSILMKSPHGLTFVQLYYKYSPPLAGVIEKRGWLRCISRYLLIKPVVWLISVSYRFGILAEDDQDRTGSKG